MYGAVYFFMSVIENVQSLPVPAPTRHPNASLWEAPSYGQAFW